MKITVKLFATFREGRQKIQYMDLPEGTTPIDIYNILEIDKEQVFILLINGRDGKPDCVLAEDDTISLFPPVGGG